MFKKPIIFLFGIIICISVFGQNSNDSIQIIKMGTNYRYEQHGNVLNSRQLTQIMRTDKEATKYLKSAKLSNGISTFLELTSGILIGYPIGRYIAGGGANLSMLAAGIGFLIVDIPIQVATKRNISKSIHLYNTHKTETSLISNDYDFHMGITQNGIGITFKF